MNKHIAHYTTNTNNTSPESPHHCILTHNNDAYTGTDQLGKLCRKLKTGTLEIYRNDKLSLTVNVEQRAALALSESKTTGLRLSKYRKFDAASFDKQG